jgi:hypothetical protein
MFVSWRKREADPRASVMSGSSNAHVARWLGRLAVGLTVAALTSTANVASASWMQNVPLGQASARAVTVGAGNAPTTNVAGRSVTLTWAASTYSSGGNVAGYAIKRYDAAGLLPQTIAGSCANLVASTTCSEAAPAGTWRYSVTPAVGNWRGPESPQVAVTVAAQALSLSPTLTRAATTLSGSVNDFIAGETLTFRLDGATGTVLAGTLAGAATPAAVPVSGGGTVAVALPAGLSSGAHTVYAVASPSGDIATQPITVDNAAPPVPTITAGPSGSTTATTAAFTFSDTEAGVTFACALDGAAATSCGSPASYTGLANGAHTFSVTATDGAGNVSAAASRTWTVIAPTGVATFPADGAVYSAAGYTAGCSTATTGDICGTLPGGTGATVQLSIRRDSTGKYWKNSSFNGPSEQLNTPTVVSSSWSYALAASEFTDGSYTIRVVTTDAMGNTTSTTSTYTIDATAPPQPTFALPVPSTASSSAGFTFSDTEAGVTLHCWFDGGTAAACTSPSLYRPLANGPHTFAVTATDAVGNVSAAASYSWTVAAAAPGGSITFPANGGSYHFAGFNAGCSSATTGDICGSAGAGASTVQVSIRQVSTGLYFDGAGFVGASEALLPASGTTSWSYPLNVGSAANGDYAIRYYATNGAGNTSAASPTTIFTLDTAAPAALVPAATNGGTTVGRLEQGDTLTFATSERLLPSSILAGWTGSSTNVTVRVTSGGTDLLTVYNGGAPLNLGGLDLQRSDFAAGTVDFTGSTMLQSGGTITLTLGTPDQPARITTAAGAANMRWTPAVSATDLAGNALPATSVDETDNDPDF